MIIRLSREPRAVELEIASPLGLQLLGPLEEALTGVRTRALGTVSYETSSHVVLRTKLVGMDGASLDDRGIGQVLEALRTRLATSARPDAGWSPTTAHDGSPGDLPLGQLGSRCDRAA
jgi:hypothetical protein